MSEKKPDPIRGEPILNSITNKLMCKENQAQEEQVSRANQTVVLFEGHETGKQEASYYHDQKFVSVLHDGQEMNMTVENWRKLVAMVSTVIPAE